VQGTEILNHVVDGGLAHPYTLLLQKSSKHPLKQLRSPKAIQVWNRITKFLNQTLAIKHTAVQTVTLLIEVIINPDKKWTDWSNKTR
jgi:hypothetical protein